MYSELQKILLVFDFNAEESVPNLPEFRYEYKAHNIVKEKSCFKSLQNPVCIDLIITITPLSLPDTNAASCRFTSSSQTTGYCD